MSVTQHNQQEHRQQGGQEQPLQPSRRHVSASPDDLDEDMEQGTQSGTGSPRNAESAAPDLMNHNRDRQEENY